MQKLTRKFFKEKGRIGGLKGGKKGGAKTAKRFKKMSQKEKSAIMQKVSLARFKKPSKKYLKEISKVSRIVDLL